MLSFISALPPSLHLPPNRSPARCTLSTSLPLTPTPRGPSVSYAQILSHSVSAVESLVTANPPTLHLTLDFPPDRSETDTGTLVSRYENNLNFAEKLLLELGASSPTPVGPNVQICDNINPQGGGEYLTDDEVMVGLKAPVERLGGRVVTVLLNAGVDVDSLKQIPSYDSEKGVVVLVNCALERVGWFARLGGFGEFVDSFEAAYYLKNMAGRGWLLKRGTGKWTVFVERKGGCEIVCEMQGRPRMVDVEKEIRLAIAGINRKRTSLYGKLRVDATAALFVTPNITNVHKIDVTQVAKERFNFPDENRTSHGAPN